MDGSSPARIRPRAVAVFAACGAAFVAAHTWHAASWSGAILERSPDVFGQSRVSFAFWAAAHSAVVFAAFALGTIAFARRVPGRVLWALPIVAFVASPLPLSVGFGDGRGVLRPLLEAPGMVRPTLFAALQLAAVLLAALPFALRRGPRRAIDSSDVIALAICGAAALFVYLIRQYGAQGSFDVNTAMHLPLAFLFLAGTAISVRRASFPVTAVLMALALSDAIFVVLDWAFPINAFALPWPERLRVLGSAMMPGIVAIAFGSLTGPLARYLRTRKQPQPAPVADPA